MPLKNEYIRHDKLCYKVDKIYNVKYLFKQKLFGINPSSVIHLALKMDWFWKAFGWINILSYISCLVYYLIDCFHIY